MRATVNYSNSPTKSFDAVEDVKEWLGTERWEYISPMMAKIVNCEHFACYAGLAGIHGFPVIAWYELYHGQGSWRDSDG